MPEGDTIHYAALRVGGALAGHVPDRIVTPHPRFARERWPERLAGRPVEAVEARGKHLLLHFAGGLAIHSHLRMSGAWRVLPRGERWPRSPHAAWLVIGRGDDDVVQFNGPVLELLTEVRLRSDPRLRGLGPDIVAAAPFDEARFLRRLREDDPTRTFGDALLDQHTVAGIGNFWKSEGCWAAGVDPWRPLAAVSDDEALAVVRALRPLMQRSAADGRQDRFRTIYDRAGRPCPRCGAASRIRLRGQGDDNRTTYWCPSCQT
jgi:endonuclease VIII